MQRQCLASAGGVLLLFGAAACGVPRPYSTPRTTPAGRISHSIAVEAGDAAFGKQNEDELVAPEGWLAPGTYTLRVGVFERWEAAASVGTLLLAGEVKFNFRRNGHTRASRERAGGSCCAGHRRQPAMHPWLRDSAGLYAVQGLFTR